MFTIYNPGREIQDEIYGSYHANFIPFDMEKKHWKLVKNVKEAQFIAVNGQNISPHSVNLLIQNIKNLNLEQHQKLLIFFIWHIDNKIRDKDHFIWIKNVLSEQLSNESVIIHMNFANDQEIQYDFMWNRQKIYFTDYNYINLKKRSYTHNTDANTFQLAPIEKIPLPQDNQLKHFLSPIRIYSGYTHPRFLYRKRLKDILISHSNKGYYSDLESGNMLTCEDDKLPFVTPGGGWYPIANKFYNSTFLSTYIETITGIYDQDYTDVKYKLITEKTYDPLIKGHFILPFAYPGFIEHLKSYGFLLPDWIDYSYDAIEDNEERFVAFSKSLEKYLQYSTEDLLQLYNKDYYILEHNRNIFWDRPYDSLYQKVKDFFHM